MFGKVLGLTLALTFSNSVLGKEVKRMIVVGEKIIENNPWRNDLIKRQYQIAIDQALLEHKTKHPNSKLQIVASFDEGPAEGFSLAEKLGAIGVAGYLYSSEAFEASQIAQNKKIPYLSPVSPLNSIRSDYSYSLAASHQDLTKTFSKLSQRLNLPSIIAAPETQLANFEYSRVYKEAFNVVGNYQGITSQVWEGLTKDLPKLCAKGPINLLFAGFAFEQMDLAKTISSSPFAEKINMVAHAQWGYSIRLLEDSLPAQIPNLYVVTDCFDPSILVAQGLSSKGSEVEIFQKLKAIIEKEPNVKGHSIDEPIIYSLKDMISIALDAGERSQNRDDFNRIYSSIEYRGACGTYKVKDKKSERNVYLGKWEEKKLKPIATL